jgi:hypothetical protein
VLFARLAIQKLEFPGNEIELSVKAREKRLSTSTRSSLRLAGTALMTLALGFQLQF